MAVVYSDFPFRPVEGVGEALEAGALSKLDATKKSVTST